MDWVVGLPELTRNGQLFNAILVVTDRATRMVHLIPTNAHETSEDTADLFLRNVVVAANVFVGIGANKNIHCCTTSPGFGGFEKTANQAVRSTSSQHTKAAALFAEGFKVSCSGVGGLAELWAFGFEELCDNETHSHGYV